MFPKDVIDRRGFRPRDVDETRLQGLIDQDSGAHMLDTPPSPKCHKPVLHAFLDSPTLSKYCRHFLMN